MEKHLKVDETTRFLSEEDERKKQEYAERTRLARQKELERQEEYRQNVKQTLKAFRGFPPGSEVERILTR